MDFIEAADLTQHVKEATHRAGNILDLALSSPKNLCTKPPVVMPIPSLDHKALLVEVNVPPPEVAITVDVVQHDKVDWKAVQDEIQFNMEVLPDSIRTHAEAEEFSDHLHESIARVVKTHLDKTKVKRKIKPSQPYFTTYIGQMQSNANKLYKAAVRVKTEAAWQAYNHQMSVLCREVHTQQVKYENALIRDYSNNMTKFHKYMSIIYPTSFR